MFFFFESHRSEPENNSFLEINCFAAIGTRGLVLQKNIDLKIDGESLSVSSLYRVQCPENVT